MLKELWNTSCSGFGCFPQQHDPGDSGCFYITIRPSHNRLHQPVIIVTHGDRCIAFQAELCQEATRHTVPQVLVHSVIAVGSGRALDGAPKRLGNLGARFSHCTPQCRAGVAVVGEIHVFNVQRVQQRGVHLSD